MTSLGRRLVAILEGTDPATRDRSFAGTCAGADVAALLEAHETLDAYQQDCDNLYRRVRALLFLAALNRLELVPRLTDPEGGMPSSLAVSARAASFRRAAFDALAEQVRTSVRASEGNAWLFECDDPNEVPLVVGDRLRNDPAVGLRERTPVRMDLSHSGWSDIFFLAMDDPDAARVVNLSIDLAVHGSGRAPAPPIEARLRTTGRPVLRLVSDDLRAEVELETIPEVFAFDADALGLLRAGVVASGLVPPGLERCEGSLAPLLARLVGEGRGLELATRVCGIPKGSRLAVSTLLLASMIAVCMRATGQTTSPTGPLGEEERRRVAARAVLGEWLGGSAGGWQDSGGLWPGAKRIEGARARPGDPEFGRSAGRLLPDHTPLPSPPGLRDDLRRRLLLVHGGMSGDVGPVLERVTEDYLLRREPGFGARREARRIYDDVVAAWLRGDASGLARATDRNFAGPLQTILPQANNLFTQTLLERLRARLGDDFHGFWMLGGMSGGGMGFWVEPRRREAAREELTRVLEETTRDLADALPFSSPPIQYDFAVNDHGSVAEIFEVDRLEPLSPPAPLRSAASGRIEDWLRRPGFDPEQHRRTREALRGGEIGVARNRLDPGLRIEDARPGDLTDADRAAELGNVRGRAAIAAGRAAVVTLAGGVGSRWTRGAEVVKALHPVCAVAGRHRRFLDFHLARTRHVASDGATRVPHLVTTSYATHEPIARRLARLDPRDPVEVRISEGRRFGLRLIPTLRDLDADSLRDPELRRWVVERGEAGDFREAEPRACLHPPGHAYEPLNLLSSGALAALLDERPDLEVLFVHNLDTLGARLDPGLLGWFLDEPVDLAFELVPRLHGDVGGGLARVDGRLRLVEGLALPRAEIADRLSTYSSMSTWLRLDPWLRSLGLGRDDLRDPARVEEAVRAFAERLPSYVTLKQVRGRDANGRESDRVVAQVEKLWGDVSALPELRCGYLRVPRVRGQQLKDPLDLDTWLRDGSAESVAAQCDWGD